MRSVYIFICVTVVICVLIIAYLLYFTSSFTTDSHLLLTGPAPEIQLSNEEKPLYSQEPVSPVRDYDTVSLIEQLNLTVDGVKFANPSLNDSDLKTSGDGGHTVYRRGPDSFIQNPDGSLLLVSITSFIVSVDNETRRVRLELPDGEYPRELTMPENIPIFLATYEVSENQNNNNPIPPIQVLTETKLDDLELNKRFILNGPTAKYPNGFVFIEQHSI